MSDALIGFGDLLAVAAPAAAPGSGRRLRPTVAVLTAAAAPQPAAAAVALALAAACGSRVALIGCVAAAPPSGLLHLPASLSAVARLRRDGIAAHPCGRLVWLPAAPGAAAVDADPVHADAAGLDATHADVGAAPDAAADAPDAAAPDAPDAAATTSCGPAQSDAALELSGRLVAAVRRCELPAVLGIGGARSDELDRTLARHDGVIVVLPGDAAPPLVAATLASLTRLGRPAAAMPAPRRLGAAGARGGLFAPRAAVEAVAALDVGLGPR